VWNKKLLVLNGLAILAVVMNHSAHRGFTAMFWWAHRFQPVVSPNFDQLGSVSYYVLSIILQLTIFSVPAFLFVSGFFVAYAARGTQGTIKWSTVKVRIVNLLIPYLIWSVVIFIRDFVLGYIDSPAGYLERLLLGGAIQAYFFVPLLIQFYLLSPFIVRLARERWKLLLIISALLQFGANLIWYSNYYNVSVFGLNSIPKVPPWAFPTMILFFSLGVIAGLHMKEFKDFLVRSKWILLGITIFAALFSFLEYQAYTVSEEGVWLGDFRSIFNNIYSLAFIGAFLAFDLPKVLSSKELIQIGKKSYGIYLVHVPVLTLVSRILYHVAPWALGYQLIFQSILIATGIGVPMILMEIVVRSPARRYYKYIFG
jgi:peptidoglycan/LPS O-acetylase OafA/YrhL